MSADVHVEVNGDTWKVLSMGARRYGKTYCHLASETRFREQRNGRVPMQISDWLDDELLVASEQPATGETSRHRGP